MTRGRSHLFLVGLDGCRSPAELFVMPASNHHRWTVSILSRSWPEQDRSDSNCLWLFRSLVTCVFAGLHSAGVVVAPKQ
jgi:hypothetical protein